MNKFVVKAKFKGPKLDIMVVDRFATREEAEEFIEYCFDLGYVKRDYGYYHIDMIKCLFIMEQYT